MIHREADPMRIPFRARPKSFLDSARRDWQFDAFAWLLRNCGGYPKFLETMLVLPIDEHFPDPGMSGHAAVAATFRRVRDHAGMADWPCIVEPRPSHDAQAGAAQRVRVIHYDSAQQQPAVLVAHFARELARYLVENVEEAPAGGPEFHGPAVELAAVFMGFGVFMANASVDPARWELNEGELVHALAMFCLLSNTAPEIADPHLNPHLRKYLRLAARDLAQHAGGFQRLRSIFVVSRSDTSERTLPKQA
jgi:hypothetical protein